MKVAAAGSGLSADQVDKLVAHDFRAFVISRIARSTASDYLQRRFVGHAGIDVHEVSYMLDPRQPTAEAMALWQPIVDLLEADIDDQLDGSLLVPTRQRFLFPGTHRLARHLESIEASLAEVGWLLLPSATDGEARVGAQEMADALNYEVKWVRRRMARGDIPCVEVRRGDRVIRMTRAADFLELMEIRASLRTVAEAAAEVGLTYHQLYALIQEHHLEVDQAGRGADMLLPPDAIEEIRGILARQRAALEGSLTIAEAAAELSLPHTVIETALRQGRLEVHPSSTRRCRRVSRESLESWRDTLRPTSRTGATVPSVDLATVGRITGLTRPMVTAKVQTGRFAAVARGRQQGVTIDSLAHYVTASGDPGMALRLATEFEGLA